MMNLLPGDKFTSQITYQKVVILAVLYCSIPPNQIEIYTLLQFLACMQLFWASHKWPSLHVLDCCLNLIVNIFWMKIIGNKHYWK
jgi:hypothetical protein